MVLVEFDWNFQQRIFRGLAASSCPPSTLPRSMTGDRAHHSFEGWRVAVWLLAENPPTKRRRSAAAAKGRPTSGGYHRPSPRKKEPKVECDCIHDVSLSKFSRYLRATRV